MRWKGLPAWDALCAMQADFISAGFRPVAFETAGGWINALTPALKREAPTGAEWQDRHGYDFETFLRYLRNMSRHLPEWPTQALLEVHPDVEEAVQLRAIMAWALKQMPLFFWHTHEAAMRTPLLASSPLVREWLP